MVRHQRDRRKAGDRVIAEVLVERGADGERARACEQQRVAIGLGRRDELRREGAAGARPVLDDDRLAEPGRQMLRDEACHHVDRPARRERHDQLNEALGIRRRASRASKHARGWGKKCAPRDWPKSIHLMGTRMVT